MEFPVPQFIEMETKIVGPLTWRQFLFIGGAGVLIFFLYFIIKHIFLFIAIAIVLAALAISFALLKIGGRPLPNVLLHFLTYTISSKIYIWKKEKILSTFVYKKEKIKPEKKKTEEGLPLRVAEKSRLQDLSTQVELRTK
jgi:hypothetical protein